MQQRLHNNLVLTATIFLVPGIVGPCAAAGNRADESSARPNVVFIMADDLGYGDLGCYGCPDIQTPELDRLAQQGVRLTDFYANAPICSPTRYAFLTGRYQHRDGLEWALYYQEKGSGLPVDGTTIPDLLRHSGYATAISGKWHLGYDRARSPIHQGFDRFFGLLGGNHHYFEHMDRIGVPDLFFDEEPIQQEGYSTDLITDYAVQFLRAIKDGPFFLYVPYNAPHFPFQGPGDAGRIVKPKAASWQRGTRGAYVAMVERMDEGIGRLLSELDRLDLSSQTLVVFTSDNGGDVHSRNAPLAMGKGVLWEGGIRVPCIARWPNVLPTGTESSQVGITMDWSATILKLAGLLPSAEHPLDGIDLLPVLSGDTQTAERTLCWRRVKEPIRKKVRPHRALRQGYWKYIDEPDGRRYLYNLSRDIGETENLVDQQPQRVARMKRLLDDWEAGR